MESKRLETKFLEETLRYTGKELKSHFAYRTFNIIGDSLVAFTGGCEVEIGDLVDIADAKRKDGIFSEEMLHFIGEFFCDDLEKTILRQRLLMSIIKDEVEARTKSHLVRVGDDVYDGSAKLTVSIATASPVSTLIHAAVNIVSEGTPVKAKGLNDYGIEARPFGEAVLNRFKKELEGVRVARCKVRGVS